MSRIKLALPKALRLDEMTLPHFWQILVTLFTAAFPWQSVRTQRQAGGRGLGEQSCWQNTPLRARKSLKRRRCLSDNPQESGMLGRYFPCAVAFDSILRRERASGGRCLAGSSRWKTVSDQRKLFVRAIRCQHDRAGLGKGVAPACANSSAKHRRALADRFWQQQRHFFEQAANPSSHSTHRQRSNHNRRSGFQASAADCHFTGVQNGDHATDVPGDRRHSLLASCHRPASVYTS